MRPVLMILHLLATLNVAAQKQAKRIDSMSVADAQMLVDSFPFKANEILLQRPPHLSSLYCVVADKNMENTDSLKKDSEQRYKHFLKLSSSFLRKDTFHVGYFGKLSGKYRAEYNYFNGKLISAMVNRVATDTILPPDKELYDALTNDTLSFFIRHPAPDTIVFYVPQAIPSQEYARRYAIVEALLNIERYLKKHLHYYRAVIIGYMRSPHEYACYAGIPMDKVIELAIAGAIKGELEYITKQGW